MREGYFIGVKITSALCKVRLETCRWDLWEGDRIGDGKIAVLVAELLVEVVEVWCETRAAV